ncbi:hypothetical protein KAFR_0C04070 [Kazachstania africana CBS 2517]|uniref:RNA recognition motif domain-containing protein n=1 Tax=Kazachstania africana (strain ATCC 22294 / BCRC 22015 / CBS 2517 / CECT 1963 / NBRC 1671 / NRRL Y-8276) TaxID=1071382 RepID=H2ASP8_KAZAF|nr:hypothetical protein KAFR_0C04070 [Kazachstania africana CBS 2517]CCF57398.1 hypothetical protein KAFR_0C04070 [Kazachstania africana CBS 2517]
MSENRTLESLRAKIIASLGKKDENSTKEHVLNQNSTYNRQPPSGPRASVPPRNDAPAFPSGPSNRYHSSSQQRDPYQDMRGQTDWAAYRHEEDMKASRYRTRNRDQREQSYSGSRYENRGDNKWQRQGTRYNNSNYGNNRGDYGRANLNYNQQNYENRRTNYRYHQTRPNGPFAGNKEVYENFSASTLNSKLIVKGITVDDVENLKSALKTFMDGQQQDFKMENFFFHEPLRTAIVDFNSAECTTMVFSCRSFFNKRASLLTTTWYRPNGYVEQIDSLNPKCGSNVIALEELNEDNVSEILKSKNITNCQIFPLNYLDKESNAVPTGCCLLVFDKLDDAILKKLSPLKWFKPNESETLKQTVSSLNFGTLKQKVKEKYVSQSKVLVLLNCVDPVDLKEMDFVKIVEEKLTTILKEDVEMTKIVQPSVNYRLNFEHVKEHAGNIYVKFITPEAALKAMERISGTQFNGRTILTAFVNENDFDTPKVLL